MVCCHGGNSEASRWLVLFGHDMAYERDCGIEMAYLVIIYSWCLEKEFDHVY